jgi:hypothetical protein
MTGCQSIFDNDTHRLSMFADELVSVVAAPSELNFEFDDFVLNSQAYRRVFAKAQAQNSREVHVQNITEDLIDFSEEVLEDSDTITIKGMNQDLVSLNLSLQGQSSVPSVSSTQGDTPSAAPIPRKPLATSTFASPDQTTASVPKGRKNSRECSKCGEAISGQFVKAFELSWHLECFTCHVGVFADLLKGDYVNWGSGLWQGHRKQVLRQSRRPERAFVCDRLLRTT